MPGASPIFGAGAALGLSEDKLRERLAAEGISIPGLVVPAAPPPAAEVAAVAAPAGPPPAPSEGLLHRMAASEEANSAAFRPLPPARRSGVVDAPVALGNAGFASTAGGLNQPPPLPTSAPAAAAAGPAPAAGPAATAGGAPDPNAAAPGPTPAKYVGAGWDLSRIPFKPGTQKEEWDNVQEQAARQEDQAKLATSTQSMYADKLEQEAIDSQQRLESNKAREAARQQAQQAERDKLAQTIDGVKEQSVDGSKFWHSPGAIFMAIGAAMGGGAAARVTGRNEGMIALENAINRDIDQQKYNIDAKRNTTQQKLGAQQNLVELMRGQFDDERKADLAASIAAHENAAQRVDAFVAKSKSQELALRGEAIKTQLAQTLIGLKKQYEAMSYVPAHMVGGGAGPAAKPDPLFVPDGPHGSGYRARTEKEASELRGLVMAKQNMVPKLERLKVLRAESNPFERGAAKHGMWESERAAEMRSLQAQVALGLRELSTTSPGAMDKGMQDLAGDINGDWLSMQGHPEKAADSAIASIRNQLDGAPRAQGAQSAVNTVAVTPSGAYGTTSVGLPEVASPRAAMPKSFKPAGGK